MGFIFLVVTGSQKIIQFIILTFCSFFQTTLVVIITHTYIHTYIHKLYLSSDFSVAYIASISD